MTDPFFHPFSESYPAEHSGIGEETLNSWAVASLVVDAAIKNSGHGRGMFHDLITTSNPLFDSGLLLSRCCDRDEAAIRQAIAMCCEGLEKKAAAALKNKELGEDK